MLLRLVTPVTFTVEPKSVTLLTSSLPLISTSSLIVTVPSIMVLPLSVSTLNLFAPLPFSMINCSLSDLTLRVSRIAVSPETSRVPVTVRLSVTLVSPVAESRIRLPDVVLISLVPSTPISMLLAVISVDVIAWLKVIAPLTV